MDALSYFYAIHLVHAVRRLRCRNLQQQQLQLEPAALEVVQLLRLTGSAA